MLISLTRLQPGGSWKARREAAVVPFLVLAALPVLATPEFHSVDVALTSESSIAMPASGSFAYDSTAGIFTAFVVPWNGIASDLTSPENSPVILRSFSAPSCATGTGQAASMLLTVCQDAPNRTWTARDCCSYSGILPLVWVRGRWQYPAVRA